MLFYLRRVDQFLRMLKVDVFYSVTWLSGGHDISLCIRWPEPNTKQFSHITVIEGMTSLIKFCNLEQFSHITVHACPVNC
jgi:hypothetical protein